jgi:MinD superfamily P-loop ATPase
VIRQVAVVSGKGGTGKTSLTAAFAQVAAPIVVVDADVDAADLHLVLAPQERERHEYLSLPVAHISAEDCMLCMACAEICRFDAIAQRDDHVVVDAGVCEGCRACALICPVKAIDFLPRCTGVWIVADTAVGPLVHARLHPGAEHAGKLTIAVRDRGRALAAERGLDLVLIDGPPGIGCAATAAIAGVDLAVAVTEPTPAAEADLERLWQRAEQLRVPLALIINHCDRNPPQAERMLARARARGGHPLGSLPTDPAFRAAQRAGTSVLGVAGPGLREAIEGMWARLHALLKPEPSLPAPAERSVP